MRSAVIVLGASLGVMSVVWWEADGGERPAVSEPGPHHSIGFLARAVPSGAAIGEEDLVFVFVPSPAAPPCAVAAADVERILGYTARYDLFADRVLCAADLAPPRPSDQGGDGDRAPDR